MVDDLFQVGKYIRKYHKPEDPIPDKSKSRVLRMMAHSIRRNPKMPDKSPCHICYYIRGTILPIHIKVCQGCFNKIMKKVGKVRVLKKEFADYHCDMCLGRTFTVYSINPWVCQKCSLKIGDKHRRELPKIKLIRAENTLRRKMF